MVQIRVQFLPNIQLTLEKRRSYEVGWSYMGGSHKAGIPVARNRNTAPLNQFHRFRNIKLINNSILIPLLHTVPSLAGLFHYVSFSHPHGHSSVHNLISVQSHQLSSQPMAKYSFYNWMK